MTRIYPTLKPIIDRLLQLAVSTICGFFIAVESSVLYFTPCFLAVVLDVVSAVYLSKRIHKKHPERADGKFKSEYKYRVIATMIIVFIALLIAHYVDGIIFKGGNQAQCWVLGFFLVYEVWSIFENWSSENDNKIAKAFQRIMVNKAERHLNVELSDILFDEDKTHDNEKDK